MLTALAVGLGAELLLLACALAAWRLHRVRRRGLDEVFATAEVRARQAALQARIVDARIEELSELVIEEILGELDLGSATDQG